MERLPISERWFAIVNPVAGMGRGLEDFPQISKLLRDNSIPADPVFTEHKYHATELTVGAIQKGYRKIIVIGGDGTLHEVVNGLFIQHEVPSTEVTLAVISIGTGNDWIRMFGIPRNYSAAIRAMREGCTFLQDVGEITYEEAKYVQTRYVANVAGGGLDAHTIKLFNHSKMKGRKGKSLYLWSLVRAFFGYKSPGVKVWIDDKLVYNDLLFSFAIGICKFNGGGIQQLPAAVADDGLFDVTLIRPVHWWHIVFRLKKLFNGKIYEIGHVQHLQGSHIKVEASPEMPLEVDGELLGHTPLNFNILHRVVRVIVNKDFL